ncbi:MAG: SDR family oxidoreductase [Actinomycetota bacterium]
MKDLKGANAIVTGASRGLGVLIADALADEGVNLVIAARSAEGLEKARGDIAAKGVKVVSVPTDVTDRQQLETLVVRSSAELGPIDILINNAGILDAHPYESYPLDDIEQLIQVNLTAPMLLTRLVLPAMIERNRGHIVQLASLAGKGGFPFEAPYAATKSALIMLTHVLRAELAETNVGVSAVCPGFVADEGMYADMQRDTGVAASRILGVSKPEKVAQAVIKAIKRNASELIVNPTPMRGVLVATQMFPDISPRVMRFFGATALGRRIAAGLGDRERAPGPGSP